MNFKDYVLIIFSALLFCFIGHTSEALANNLDDIRNVNIQKDPINNVHTTGNNLKTDPEVNLFYLSKITTNLKLIVDDNDAPYFCLDEKNIILADRLTNLIARI